MAIATIAALGLAAGFHGALYGAYKDSPHESFLARRFVREIVIALGVALVLASLPGAYDESMFVLYLSIFALTRTVTEFWKLFVRVEHQDGFRIPTQIHCVYGIIHNPVLRLLLGIGFLASIYGIYALGLTIPDAWPGPLRGLMTGLSIGIAERSKATNLLTLQNLLSAADQALYEAKSSNRNCIKVYQSPRAA